jgi:hypothetical protein
MLRFLSEDAQVSDNLSIFGSSAWKSTSFSRDFLEDAQVLD